MINRNIIPTYYCSNISSIDIRKILDKDIKYIMCDLDNTLSLPNCTEIDNNSLEFVNKCKQNSIKIIIISNNTKIRVSNFANKYNLDFIYKSNKPFINKIKYYIESKHINKTQLLILGDQTVTDIKVANKLNISSLLIDPLTKKELFKTKIIRIFDKINRKKLIKNNLLREL